MVILILVKEKARKFYLFGYDFQLKFIIHCYSITIDNSIKVIAMYLSYFITEGK